MSKSAAAAAAQTTSAPISISDVARDFLNSYGSVVPAGEAMFARALQDQALRNVLITDAMLRESCLNAVRRVLHSDRHTVRENAKSDTPTSTVSIQHWGQTVMLGILDAERLPGGKKLRDATPEDLLCAIEVYDVRRKTLETKVVFFRKLLLSIPEGKTVGDCFDDATAQQLLEEATSQVE